MSGWIPEGYIDVTALIGEHGVNKVRSDLFAGRLRAFKWDASAGDLDEFEPSYWSSNDAERSLAQGRIAHRNDELPPCMILVRVEDEPKPATGGGYVPPYMALMLAAVRHFEISEQRWPKKEELVAYFQDQKLPDGTPVSLTQAKYLMTFVRPVAAMSGGNKK